MGGPLPISYLEMLAFFQLEGVMQQRWEISALRTLDCVALDVAAKDA